MKLKYYVKNEKKIYTLKNKIAGEKIKDAHYKFVKIRNAPNKN